MRRETDETSLYGENLEEFMWYVENVDKARMEPGDLNFGISLYHFGNGVIISHQPYKNENQELEVIKSTSHLYVRAKWCLQDSAGLSFDRTSISGWKRIDKFTYKS
jgi:hypothetical protein